MAIATPIELLTHPDTLLWAFKKVEYYSLVSDSPLDQLEISRFELNLPQELRAIAEQFREGHYRLDPLVSDPILKKIEEDKPIARQYFRISVRDQVAWMALMCVLGPELDNEMPRWSYGHRMYRPAWFETDQGIREKLVFGPYRLAHSKFYRTFKHGWPLYRRHARLSSALASSEGMPDYNQLTEQELGDLEFNIAAAPENYPYALNPKFWKDKSGNAFFASIDLKEFYPSIGPELITGSLEKYSKYYQADQRIMSLTHDLLKFEVTKNPSELSWKIEPATNTGTFNGLPTGLFVSGFLSNIALLSIDKWAAMEAYELQVGHFRYVDDHIFIAADFRNLVDWAALYSEKLQSLGFQLNTEKTKPIDLNEAIKDQGKGSSFETAKAKSDLNNPEGVKLFTATLDKISELGRSEITSLTRQEIVTLAQDIRHLMNADISEDEIRISTRKSFALGRLARMASELLLPSTRKCELEIECLQLKAASDKAELDAKESHTELAETELRKWQTEYEERKTEFLAFQEEEDREVRSRIKRIFSEMLSATLTTPEKMRLWQTLVRFCASARYADVWLIRREIDIKFKDDNIRIFLKRVLANALSDQILRACRTLGNDQTLYANKDSASQFLKTLAKGPILKFLHEGKLIGIYKETGLRLRSALVLARDYLDLIGEKSCSRALASALSKAKISDFNEISKRTNMGQSAGIVRWITKRFSADDASAAIEVWKPLSPLFGGGTNEHISILALTPIEKQTLKGLHGLDDDPSTLSTGWWLDLVSRNQVSQEDTASLIDFLPPGEKAFLESLASLETEISLYAWANNASQKFEGVFDPRFGEWTALKIISKLADLVVNKKVRPQEIHPANFLVPFNWIECAMPQNARAVPWDKWRARCEDGQLSQRKGKQVTDDRLLSGVSVAGLNEERQIIHLLSLTLLGLIRNSFIWSPAFYMPGQERLRGGQLMRSLAGLAISSKTISILEACLLPRGIERAAHSSALAQMMLLGKYRIDEALEPILISNIAEFKSKADQAADDLMRLQVSVLENEPRQLVPIDLSQLASYQEPSEDEDEGPDQ